MTQITITLSTKSDVKVKKGDKVEKNQLLVVKKGKKKITEINLAKKLKVSPKKLKNHLLIALGSTIKPQDIIAQKKGMFAKTVKVSTQASGVLEELDVESGILKITQKQPDIATKSPVSATVVDITSSQLILKTQSKLYKLKQINGPSVYGELKIALAKDLSVLSVTGISSNSIVLFSKSPLSAVKKSIVLGAAGLIFPDKSFFKDHQDDLKSFLDNRDEKVSLCFVDEKTFDEITKFEGENVYLDSAGSFIAILKE